uniref:Uncharacterized protein n=1 Tax=Arundo donax TaxID=35708 RepID=A0A0A9BW93_ARUDO
MGGNCQGDRKVGVAGGN